ncbi:MAG: O-antigen ligase family protein [Verrucomicrobiota bacterium]|nr:O-antigen ligase family protein [Verrucomicrobiota bacterium]
MEFKEIIKAVILIALYFVVAPLTGFLLRHSRPGQRILMFLLCFMTTSGFLAAGEWGLSLGSVLYRGHSRGFHFYFAEVVAVALIFASMTGNWRGFRFMPPGLWVWLLYCVFSLFSIINAPVTSYVLMAALKAFKIVLIFVAAYNFIQEEEDLRHVLFCMAVTMFWQLFVVLKMKYVDHVYQVFGTFEHQNSLSMFTTMIGMVFLAVALGPKHPRSNLFLCAYIACAAIVQSTLSRGGLAMFALGTGAVLLFSLIDKPTKRRWYVMGTIAVVGGLGLLFTMDTIMSRFQDYGNDESSRTRVFLNRAAVAMFKDYPIGVGWNNFGHVINHPYPYGNEIDHWQKINNNKVDKNYKKGVVESLYHLVLSETGLHSLVVFVSFLFLFLWRNVRAAIFFRTHFLGAFSIGVFVGCTMNYAQSFLERVLTQPRNLTLWLILLGVVAKIETWRRIEKKMAATEQANAHDLVRYEDNDDLEPAMNS